MNVKQNEGIAVVQTGHNVYIGGQAGCGKSFLVREIVSWARNNGKETFDPMTIHKWTGIEDGRFGSNQLIDLSINDDRYDMARRRITSTDILIIDEISMLSKKQFDLMDTVFKSIRQSDKPFGIIQLVVVGDFLQLLRVRNARYGDSGEFCFCSEHFPTRRVMLNEVIRQDDAYFSSVVKAVSIGKKLDETMEMYIDNLSRTLPACSEHETVGLFASNSLVDMFNRDSVLSVPGQLYSFDSIDEGEERYLHSLIVQKTVWLKTGARVMLLRNLSAQLVNGLRGRVAFIREGEVDVYFPTINKTST